MRGAGKTRPTSRDPERGGGRGPGAYAVATLGLTAGGVAVAAMLGAPLPAAAAGAASAWAIQAVAIWKLAEALDRGVSAVPAWAGGIGARLAGLAAAWVAGGATGLDRDALLLGYGGTILLLLLLEAGWLARRTAGRWPRPPSGGADGPAEDAAREAPGRASAEESRASRR